MQTVCANNEQHIQMEPHLRPCHDLLGLENASNALYLHSNFHIPWRTKRYITLQNKEINSTYTDMRERERMRKNQRQRGEKEVGTDTERESGRQILYVPEIFLCMLSNFQRFGKLLNDIYILNGIFVRVLSIFYIFSVPRHIQSKTFSV